MGQEEEDGNESEIEEPFDEEEDCESVFSDIQFDDASSIASFSCGTNDETLLLDLWVETIVDIIFERYCYDSSMGVVLTDSPIRVRLCRSIYNLRLITDMVLCIKDKRKRETNEEDWQSNRAEVMPLQRRI